MRGDRLTRSYWLHFHSYRYQGFKLLMLGVSVVCLESLFGLAPSQADVLMDPWSSLTSEEKQFRDELWENVGYRGYGYLTKPYSDEAVFAALDALEHSEGVMTGLVLGVLSKAIQQFEVPPKLLRETVVPQLRGLLAEQEAQEDQQAREVVKWTEQVLWHCEVNLLTDAAARRAFLAPSLRDGRRGESHQLTAMEYCVQWGDAETEALVQRELDAERAKPHPRQRLAVRLGPVKIEFPDWPYLVIEQGPAQDGDEWYSSTGDRPRDASSSASSSRRQRPFCRSRRGPQANGLRPAGPFGWLSRGSIPTSSRRSARAGRPN